MSKIKIGWGHRELSMEGPVSLPGQMYMRISEGIHDPLTGTALCIDGGEGQDVAIFLTCDVVSLPGEAQDLIRQKVESAADPLFAGLQFAVLGNYLDFAALQGQVSFEKLEAMLDTAFTLDLDKEVYADFCRELEQGRKLLYLTDNAGEIGFDRIFAEAIAQRYPHVEITFCVRGGNIINDATRVDAAAVGMPFPVIDNGNRVAGTIMELISDECKAALDAADVIIAKGQANAETMLGCGYNVYYAFLVKCIRFQRTFNKPKLTPMLVAERR